MGPPLPGVREKLIKLKELGHNILIHSCNHEQVIRKWMDHYELPFDYIWTAKPVCDAYIDDRAVGFRGDWDAAFGDAMNLVEDVEFV